jgi:FKBP-type peptidyl-prolyl cis-trans isomerase
MKIKGGIGRPLVLGDRITLHYAAALSWDDLDAGRYVDSSDWQDQPVRAVLGDGSLLTGLNEALSGASYGDTVRVDLEPMLAFGGRGLPGRVPGNASLYFQIEISVDD